MSRLIEAEEILHPWVTQPPMLQPPPNIMLAQDEVIALNAALVDVLQKEAKVPGVRIYMFNMLGQNNFNTQAYRDLFVDTCIYASALKSSGANNYLARAVGETIKVEIVRLISSEQRLVNYMDQQGMHALNEYRQLAANISGMIRNVQMAGQQQQYPQMGYQQPMMGMPQMQQPMNMAGPIGGYNNHYSGGSNMSSMLGSTQAAMSQHQTSGLMTYSGPDVNHGVSNQEPTSTFTNLLDTTSNVPVTEQPIVAAMENSIMNQTANLHVTWHDSKMPPVLRVDQVLIIEDGKYGVRDMIGYEELESNQDMISLHRDVTGFHRNVETGPSLRSLLEVEEVSEETQKESINLGAVVRHNEALSNYSLGALLVDGKLLNVGVTGSTKNAFEVTGHLMTPLDVGELSHSGALLSLAEQPTLTRFVDKLASLKDEMPVGAWMLLHDKLTDIYNRRLKVGKTGFDIDSITEDYADSCEVLSKGVVVTALDRFRDNTLAIMLASVEAYVLNESDDSDVYEWGVREYVTLTHLPIMSEALGIKLPEEYSLLGETTSPDIYDIFAGIYNRSKLSGLKIARQFVVTSDNVYIELHVNDYGKRALVINKHK